MILVRVGEDEQVDPAIPRRQSRVERDEQPVRVRPAVDQQATAATALDEDRVALADVEDRHPDAAVGPVRRRDDDGRDADGHARPRAAGSAAGGRRLPAARPARPGARAAVRSPVGRSTASGGRRAVAVRAARRAAAPRRRAARASGGDRAGDARPRRRRA